MATALPFMQKYTINTVALFKGCSVAFITKLHYLSQLLKATNFAVLLQAIVFPFWVKIPECQLINIEALSKPIALCFIEKYLQRSQLF